MKKLKVFLIVVAACGLFYYYKSRPNFQDWILQTDVPIVEQFDKGAKLYNEGDFAAAAAAYEQAQNLAIAADLEANRQWQEMHGMSDEWRQRLEKLKPQRQYLLGKDKSLYRGGVFYFKSRISEADYCLALSLFQALKFKYQLDNPNAFSPPNNVLDPIWAALARGLQACPQSESLRLLKAEILTAVQAYAQAIPLLEETLLIDPQSAEAYNQLGLIYSSRFYLQSENTWREYQQRALEMFKKATQGTTLDGGKLPAPFYNLGMFYATPDASRAENALPAPAEAALAREYLRQFIALTVDKNSALVQNAEKILQRLGN